MDKQMIILEFGTLVLEAELFDSAIARMFAIHLPCHVNLTRWGNELYGPTGKDLGAENPVSQIPPGGIAYSTNGGYLCVFFGQTPAWPVEYIGQIVGDGWEQLADHASCDNVIVRLKS